MHKKLGGNFVYYFHVAFLAALLLSHNFSNAGDLRENGMISGGYREDANNIIINGATFYNKNNSATIEIDVDSPKNIVISNVNIISEGQKIKKNSGSAGVFVINRKNSLGRVSVRNVRVRANNLTVVNEGGDDVINSCVTCIDTSGRDRVSGVSASVSGNTILKARQTTSGSFIRRSGK